MGKPPINFSQAKRNPGLQTNFPTNEVAWSAGRNIRFAPGSVSKCGYKEKLVDLPLPLPILAAFAFRAWDGIVRHLVCCSNKVYAYTDDFTTVADITPATITEKTDAVWQFTLVAGLPVLSNGTNNVWGWQDMGGILTPLGQTPVSARGIFTAMHRLCMAGFQDGAFDLADTITWSRIGNPENRTLDLSARAGQQPLVDPSGQFAAKDRFVAAVPQAPNTLIFTDNNIWQMTPVVYPHDFAFHVRFPGSVLAGPRLTVAVGNDVYFMGTDDFYRIGQGLHPLGIDIANQCFPNLNNAKLASGFAYYRPTTKEVVFCVATASNATPDTEFVYQLETKTWSIRDCDYTCYVPAWSESAYTWDVNPFGAYDSAPDSQWDDTSRTGVIPYEVVGNATGTLFKLDHGFSNGTLAVEGFIETGDMDLGYPNLNKSVHSVRPNFKPIAGEMAVMIQVGARRNLSDDIVWSFPLQFTPGVDDQVTCRTSGKYIRFRFFTDRKDSPWILTGFTADATLGGSR